ncbi:Arylsulfatase [Caulifigura coniformis]|uniref:Arylsulfatase n=1 Tax=Caulifigura coniformis TaxID=2527983 RepID=A0A517SGJ5_9PLAN|nr:sulfatase [Caulifigura coniformis]QDT55249.1 Arylsulfatase [Caulifigura coniformis]
MKAILTLLACLAALPHPTFAQDRVPNVVIIYTDDQGYGDLGCFGSKTLDTPNIDRMAAEGVRMTDFYVAQAVCGASRAALLTGCYPNRIGMLGAPGPKTQHGIHSEEVLLPEICKQKEYATGMFGKWHLGHHRQFLPVHHGFDTYFGLPYSNDMWPFHPTNPKAYPPLPMIEGDKIVDADVTADDQPYLTTWYTERAVKFIEANHEKPFFLYVAHNMVHVPLFVSDKFRGKSRQGLYGDVVMEVDWSVGEILGAIKKQGLDEKTLVIFATDNGPWLSYGNHAGSAGPLREGKGTTFEGGVRVPCVMRWPGKIPAGTTCQEPVMTIDLLPTIARLIGAALPAHAIDGLDVWPLISGQAGARSPHDALYFYWDKELQAVRSGDWKLHFPHKYRSLAEAPGMEGRPNGYRQQTTEAALYNLRSDVGETRNLIDEQPEVVSRLRRLAEQARADLGDSATMQTGSGTRPPAMVRLIAPDPASSE